MKETYGTLPKCPHCEYEELAYFELGLDDDGDKRDVVCNSCGKTYECEISIAINYAGRPIEKVTCDQCEWKGRRRERIERVGKKDERPDGSYTRDIYYECPKCNNTLDSTTIQG